MWEIISGKLPWADEACPTDIYTRVVFKGDRPQIPCDSSAEMARVKSACWVGFPRFCPVLSDIVLWQNYQQHDIRWCMVES